MFDFDDGSRAELDKTNKAVQVYNNPDLGDFLVSGFSSVKNAETFIRIGDLSTSGKENDYLLITRSSEHLKWTKNSFFRNKNNQLDNISSKWSPLSEVRIDTPHMDMDISVLAGHIVDLNPKLDPIERKVSLDVLRCLITYTFNLSKVLSKISMHQNEVTFRWLQNILSSSEPSSLLKTIKYKPPKICESFNKRPDLPHHAVSILLLCFDKILGTET